MGQNSTEVSYGFGQMGSAFLADTAAFKPPAGKIVVAICSVGASATKFTLLTGDTSMYTAADGGTPTGASNPGTAFIQTAAVGANGTNADSIANTVQFPKGVTLFGRWSAVTLADGAVVLYFADL